MRRVRPVADSEPIVCAGVLVRPGDLVVADDDGVVVVPQDLASETVSRAVRIREADLPGRREGYAKARPPA
jgi:4-hydroxy-4-methyl-2-oxoglutarate aldolase